MDKNRNAKGPDDDDRSEEPVEHIRWRDAREAPVGEYGVIVTLYKRYGDGNQKIPYNLHIKAPGIGQVHQGGLDDAPAAFHRSAAQPATNS